MNTTPDPSAYLRDATDDLAVDTDRIVSGGVARGRTLRRRRRVGTTLAAAAVVGVIGVAASVGPGLLDRDASSPAGFASGGTTPIATPSATPSETPTKQPQQSEPLPVDRQITVSAALIPTILSDASRWDGEVSEPLEDETFPLVDEPDEKVVHFLFEGTLATFVIERADTLATCSEMVDPANQPDGEPGGECVFVDGLETLSWGPTVGDGVTSQGVSVWQHGYVVSALSYNAADGKDVPTVTDEPPVSLDKLMAAASSDTWFGTP